MENASYKSFFHNKTVTLMGLGLLGRGVGDAAFLAQHCKKVFVTDVKSEQELRASVDTLKEYKNIEFHLGGHSDKVFTAVDFVIKGAGVRLDNPYIAAARKNGIPVYMSTALFAHLAPIKIIGTTGTRGKTTVTCMIANILQRAGKKVLLGGNLRGVSTLAQLPTVDQYDVAVLELDSWQLQGFDDLKISPHIAIFTTFFPDHMNYYDGDMQLYLRDKTAIFRHQKSGDILITSSAVSDLTKQDRATRNPQSKWIVAEPLPPSFAMKIPGAHNLLNAALAQTAAEAYGIDAATTKSALHHFTGVEGRLQFIGSWQDRNFYNDSNATTQEATLAALTSFPPQSIVLIWGGADKGLPIDQLMSYICANKIRSILIKGTGSDRVLQQLPNIPTAATMIEAVTLATNISQPNDNIILSPAFASFGAFKNEYDRSDQFMQELQNLIVASKGTSCPP